MRIIPLRLARFTLKTPTLPHNCPSSWYSCPKFDHIWPQIAHHFTTIGQIYSQNAHIAPQLPIFMVLLPQIRPHLPQIRNISANIGLKSPKMSSISLQLAVFMVFRATFGPEKWQILLHCRRKRGQKYPSSEKIGGKSAILPTKDPKSPRLGHQKPQKQKIGSPKDPEKRRLGP